MILQFLTQENNIMNPVRLFIIVTVIISMVRSVCLYAQNEEMTTFDKIYVTGEYEAFYTPENVIVLLGALKRLLFAK